MNFDFALWLFVAIVITGVIALLDYFVLAPRRVNLAKTEPEEIKKKILAIPNWVELAKEFFPVFLAVFVLRSFLVEPYQIPSGSMIPTLLVGDFILVNKYTYGIRLPILNKKIIDLNDPKRGDIMVFRYPKEPEKNYIKRVIGLPGDVVRYENKTYYISGQRMPQKLESQYPLDFPQEQILTEDLSGHEHKIQKLMMYGQDKPAQEWVVPAGHYFVCGDNRDNSNDSRYWGFVPDENVVGRAFAIWLHRDGWKLSLSRGGFLQ